MERDPDCGGFPSHSILMRAELAQKLYLSLSLDQQQQQQKRQVELSQRVEQAYRIATEIAKKKKELEIDWVERIFVTLPDEASLQQQQQQQQHEEQQQEDYQGTQGSVTGVTSSNPTITGQVTTATTTANSTTTELQPQHQPSSSIQEIQAAQRAQLEEEISHMASQLKASTTRMNQSLKSQTQQLDEMGALAEQNVHQVGQAANNVNTHLKQRWSTTIATWTMMVLVLGTFFTVMFVMRWIPKRSNTSIPCFGFCNNNSHKSHPPLTLPLEEPQSSWEIPCILDCSMIPKSFGINLQHACHTLSSMMGQAFNCHHLEKVAIERESTTDQYRVYSPSNDENVCRDEECEATSLYDGTLGEFVGNDPSTAPNGTGETVKETDGAQDEHVTETAIHMDGSVSMTQPELKFTRIEVSFASAICNLGQFRYFFQIAPELAEQRDENGWTSFNECVSNGCMEVTMFLLDNVPALDVNQVTYKGATPLWWAVQRGMSQDHPVFKLLQARGGKVAGPDVVEVIEETPDEKVSTTETAFDHADADNTGPEVPDRPLVTEETPEDEAITIQTPLSLTDVDSTNPEMGPPEETPDDKTITPHDTITLDFTDLDVRKAAYLNNVEALSNFLDKAPHMIEMGDENGWVAIHEAARWDKMAATIFLISKGANVNARTSDGWSPLALANSRLGEDSEMSTLLRSHGAEVYFPTGE